MILAWLALERLVTKGKYDMYITTTLWIRYIRKYTQAQNSLVNVNFGFRFKNKLAQEAGAFEAQDPDLFQIQDSF